MHDCLGIPCGADVLLLFETVTTLLDSVTDVIDVTDVPELLLGCAENTIVFESAL